MLKKKAGQRNQNSETRINLDEIMSESDQRTSRITIFIMILKMCR